MTRTALGRGLAIGAVVVLAGCSDRLEGRDRIASDTPLGTIQVVNTTDRPLATVLISACDASTYGLNRLRAGIRIPVGSAHRFPVPAGCWDIAGGTIGVGDARGRVEVPAGEVYTFRVS